MSVLKTSMLLPPLSLLLYIFLYICSGIDQLTSALVKLKQTRIWWQIKFCSRKSRAFARTVKLSNYYFCFGNCIKGTVFAVRCPPADSGSSASQPWTELCQHLGLILLVLDGNKAILAKWVD